MIVKSLHFSLIVVVTFDVVVACDPLNLTCVSSCVINYRSSVLLTVKSSFLNLEYLVPLSTTVSCTRKEPSDFKYLTFPYLER